MCKTVFTMGDSLSLEQVEHLQLQITRLWQECGAAISLLLEMEGTGACFCGGDPNLGPGLSWVQTRAKARRVHLELTLQTYERALEALDLPDYGRCAHCGQNIAFADLRLNPGVQHCNRCWDLEASPKQLTTDWLAFT